MAYLTTTPKWLRWMHHPALVWDLPLGKINNEVFITFDDGPHPQITPWVLELLVHYQAQATFFCIGDNVRKYPDTFQQILASHHAIGNHTFHHVNGWKCKTAQYQKEINEAAQLIPSNLFRPPYGRISLAQSKQLQVNYNIIMWSVLSGDFDANIDAATCVQNVLRSIKPGAIVVFHDSEKAWPRLQYALPKVLSYIHQQGWKAAAITPQRLK